MSEILTLTLNPSIDKSSGVDRVVPEHKLRCDPPRFDPGGGGINISRAIVRLGGETLPVFPSGGHTGDYLQELLKAEGLNCRTIPIKGLNRQNLAVYERAGGQQYRFGMPGPQLDEEEWRKCLNVLNDIQGRPEFLAVSGSLPRGVPDDFYARMAQTAARQGIRLAVDCSGEPLRRALEQGVFLVKPNLQEFRDLIGEDVEGHKDLAHRARDIIDAGGSEAILISLGAAGAILAWKGGAEHIAAPAVKIRSKVGAGDSTLAGMLLGLDKGMSMPDAARLGIAAGAAAVMTPGSELCRRDDTERLYELLKNSNFSHL